MDDPPEEEAEEGAPEWLATFADLMSLLMCFFVLLLSFSEMDLQKYKQVAGSMNDAFGIQRDIPADEIPKGVSIIAQEYSPGKPDPTIMEVIKQQTTQESSNYLQTNQQISVEVSDLLEKARGELSEEIDKKILEVLAYNNGVMIRIQEQNSFASGSADIDSDFEKVLDKIITLLNKVDGEIIVAGHSDNVPISTARFPSNWVLSSARASSVVHYLYIKDLQNTDRLELRAHADTQPVVENDTRANQAKNRRIEINIVVNEAEQHRNKDVLTDYVNPDNADDLVEGGETE
ncbi:MAG: OmpA family protein [Gammaproteobacteria bacterium]|nr:OmpA family protein [Gammaproteobacteria bacterium]